MISVLIGLSVIPLLKSTSTVLMQKIPREIEKAYPKLLHKVRPCLNALHLTLHKIHAIPGVISIGAHHFWQQMPAFTVGTIHVEITSDANQQEIQNQISLSLQQYGVTHSTVQISRKAGTSLLQNSLVSPAFLSFGEKEPLATFSSSEKAGRTDEAGLSWSIPLNHPQSASTRLGEDTKTEEMHSSRVEEASQIESSSLEASSIDTKTLLI